jgi:hypothetical protein
MRLAPERTATMTRKFALALGATTVLGIGSASAGKAGTFRNLAPNICPKMIRK